MTPEEIEAAAERGTARAIDQKLGQFYIDRETHYQDHQFIQQFRKWTEEAKGTALRVVVKTIAAGAIILILLGFIVWGREHFGK